MDIENRDRASGWKYAKLSGHSNESLVKQYLDKDEKNVSDLLKRIGYDNRNVVETTIGGLHEEPINGVLGKKTKSKTDLKLIDINNKSINISIKKSLAGQVYFVRAGIFIEVYEKQFNKKIPDDVQKAINLFWASDKDAISIIEEYGDKSDLKNFELQIHHKSLNATTLKKYSIDLYNKLLEWFRNNIKEITLLCFSSGAVLDRNEWSEFVWYKNLLGENDVDKIFSIKDICDECFKAPKDQTSYSTKNGGTTIQLPFGFVQWHQAQLQFHHQFEKINKLVKGK